MLVGSPVYHRWAGFTLRSRRWHSGHWWSQILQFVHRNGSQVNASPLAHVFFSLNHFTASTGLCVDLVIETLNCVSVFVAKGGTDLKFCVTLATLLVPRLIYVRIWRCVEKWLVIHALGDALLGCIFDSDMSRLTNQWSSALWEARLLQTPHFRTCVTPRSKTVWTSYHRHFIGRWTPLLLVLDAQLRLLAWLTAKTCSHLRWLERAVKIDVVVSDL